MRDIDHRLTSSFGSLAEVPLTEPEPLPALRRRARRHRARRAAGGALALVVAVAGIGAVLSATGDKGDAPVDVELLAPNVLLGDIDAVVLSNSFDENGARTPISPEVRAAVAHVTGVEVASGVVQRFAPMWQETGDGITYGVGSDDGPPRTPILFSYHEPSELALSAGEYPDVQREVLVNRDTADRFDLEPGSTVRLETTPTDFTTGELMPPEWTVTGIFDLPGADTTGVPLAAIPATNPLDDVGFDRVDLAFSPGADPAAIVQAVNAAIGEHYVTLTPTELGIAEQRMAEVDIQRAYWGLISTDPQERFDAREPDGVTLEQMNEGYEEFRSTAASAELRVQRVNFISPDQATLVYRVYYGGSPSPIITDPQNGEAVRIDGRWKIAASTTCQLATYVAQQCPGREDQPIRPPDGWNAADTEPVLADAFRAVADPDTTVAARAEVFGAGTPATLIADGVASDRQWSGAVRFFVVGVRVTGDTAEVLYSLNTDDGGPATPYPVIGTASRAGARWLVDPLYACGLEGLANQGCYTEQGEPMVPLPHLEDGGGNTTETSVVISR